MFILVPNVPSHRYTQVKMIWYSDTSKAVQGELIMSHWASDETKTANFGDERLNKRMEVLLQQLGDKPTQSIPTACGGWAETLAAYL